MIKRITKSVQVGRYLAKVEVDVEDDTGGWGPTLSLQDVQRLEQVRRFLEAGDIKSAAAIGAIFELTPVRVA